MSLVKQIGRVEIISGSMFSGKSEELIRRVRRATYGKLQVRVFKPAMDNRYSEEDVVVSHNGTKTIARPLVASNEIFDHIDKSVDVVGIDEVQFFDKEISGVIDSLANQGIRVIAAGLDTNFRGEPFEPMPELMALSESITKLNAICPICGEAASRTQRLIDNKPASYDEPEILVGASEAYEPRCRHHHEVPNKPQTKYDCSTVKASK